MNIFTGWRDLPLTARGRLEALAVAEALATAHIGFDAAFSSALGRTRETASIILGRLGLALKNRASSSLNERDYGELTGMNKADAAARWGAEQVRLWRRSFALRPPGGESLADTAARVLPFYRSDILPLLMSGQRVLVVAHGNSLRAMIMMLDAIDTQVIERVELRTGEIRCYRLSPKGKVSASWTLS